jgi:hypothetical protein
MTDSTSIVAVAVCWESKFMHSALLYRRFLLGLIKEVGGIVFLQLTGTPNT